MEPGRSIGKLGFRRWYERRLIEGHAWLVSCVLCGLAIAVTVEHISFKKALPDAIMILAFVFVAGLVCWHSLERYRRIMGQAEHFADHSTCAQCHVYGRFLVLREAPQLKVRCRKCANEWQIDSYFA